MNAGTAITTTHAPSVNLVKRNTRVATAVMTAPVPFMTARYLPTVWPLAPPVHDQAALRQGEAGEHPDGEQRNQGQDVPPARREAGRRTWRNRTQMP